MLFLDLARFLFIVEEIFCYFLLLETMAQIKLIISAICKAFTLKMKSIVLLSIVEFNPEYVSCARCRERKLFPLPAKTGTCAAIS